MAFALGTGFTLDRVALARARLTLAAVALLALLPVLGPATFGSRAAVPSPSELAQPVSDSLASAPEGLRAVASAVINADRSGSVANGRDGVQSERGGGLAAAFPGAGPALTATGVAGRAFLGYSVAMSAD